jgi:hypothetical protein
MQESPALRDGSHDFDFNFGTWHTHMTRLLNPLSGSTTTVISDGVVTVRKVWNGRALLEEIEVDGPDGHFEGTNLYLYNPASHQWSQNFATSGGGTLGTPAIGEFKDGSGKFYSPGTYKGRSVLVESVWSDITPDSYNFTQYFSNDGGKTWEANLSANLTRLKP